LSSDLKDDAARCRWLIVADDVTGAADCAIAFAKRGIESAVGWDQTLEPSTVLSYNTNSRDLPSPEVARRHREALGGFLDRGTNLFKKIDSTLRGQPAAEIAMVMEALHARFGSALGIFAPAFPAAGRTTEEGHVHIGGGPLEQSEVWQREHSYQNADLVDVLATAGIAGRRVPLSTVRGGADALRATFADLAATGDVAAICDAVTQDDLDRIAEASLPAAEQVFFIGSAGLAHALAAATPGTRSNAVVHAKSTQGSLIVVGSLAAASRSAARVLAQSPGVRPVAAHLRMLLEADAGRRAFQESVIDGLDAGEDVLVEIRTESGPDLSVGPRVSDALGEILQPVASHMSGLAVTGGETASALFTHFGVRGLRLIDEIEPGIALGLTRGQVSVPVVTKAGAFGDEGSLTRIAARLRSIRRTGVVE